MRRQWVWLAGMTWTLLVGVAACAVTSATYQTVRASVTVTRMTDSAQLTGTPAPLAGKVVELDGIISGVVASGTGAVLLLRREGGAMHLVNLPAADDALDVGVAVRALVRVPFEGSVLTALAVIPTGPELATAPPANGEDDTGVCIVEEADRTVHLVNPPNEMPVDDHPRVVYHAPDHLQDTPGVIDPAGLCPRRRTAAQI